MSIFVKAVGVCLIFLSCALAGISFSWALGERVRALGQLIRMLEALREELSYNQTSVRQALLNITRIAGGYAREFLELTERRIEDGITPPESWRSSAMAMGGVDKADKAELASLSASLGGSGLEGQKAAIDSCMRALDVRLSDSLERKEQLSRLYSTLGVLAGVAAVVIIL